MQYKIDEISQNNKDYHNVSTESFEVFGRLDVSYQNNKWSYEEVLFDEPYNKSYEAEELNLDEYILNPNKVIFYALQDDTIIGQILIKKNWNDFCYIDSISVAGSARGMGVATSLLKNA